MRTMLLAAALTVAAAGPAIAADAVEGVWLTQTGSGKVAISPCPGQADRLCGKISWVRDPAEAAAKDANNPDPKLKTRAIIGLPTLWGFKQAAPGRWTGGRIYDPESGKTYDSKITINPNGTLKVEGCIAVICQAQTWKRG